MSSPGEHGAPPHFGFAVDGSDKLERLRERIKAFRERDPRVELLEFDSMDDVLYPDSTLHAFYVRYLIPMWIDVQCCEFRDGTNTA